MKTSMHKKIHLLHKVYEFDMFQSIVRVPLLIKLRSKL
jgi:hypothetical protein